MRRQSGPSSARRQLVAFTVLAALALRGRADAQTASSTTTTVFSGTTTITMQPPPDVGAGGDFEGGFPKGSYDAFVFELSEPRTVVLETTNGFGGCPGDTLLELRDGGYTGSCETFGDDLPCIAFDDDSGDKLCSRIVKVLQPGSYGVRVRAYAFGELRRYFLHVEIVATVCGNDQLEIGEECDDGNTAAGDCCSETCRKSAAGTPCSDGLFCNGTETCSAGTTCTIHTGNPCEGPDGDENCSETCSEASDTCTGADPAGSPCDDGIFCNGTDTCAAGICSAHKGNPCPGADGDANCKESCNESADACTGDDPDGSPCSDGLFCTGADTCAAGICTHPGNPCQGADGDLHCAESCDESADDCFGPDPDGSPCEDGLFCNGVDACIDGLCNDHSGGQCPGVDGDSNCAESCSDSQAGCGGHDPEGAPCDDGIFCNGADTCSQGSCSVHAGNPCPGPDTDGNCSESCNEAADNCLAGDPNASFCDDAIFCNGADSCTGGQCSTHAGNPCSGPDGDGNCAESCSEDGASCTGSDPNGSACDDGLFCNGDDTCTAGDCAGHEGTPCDDGAACTTDLCDEGEDACSHTDIPECLATTTTTTTPVTTTAPVTTTTLASPVCADASGDGVVKASDALAILKAAVGGDQCVASVCICDTNGNGSLSASDALLALKIAVGAPANPACPC